MLIIRPQLVNEYIEKVNLHCVRLLCEVEAECQAYGCGVEITRIGATTDDQIKICKEIGVPYYQSLHEVLNAIDAIPYGKYEPGMPEFISGKINALYPYGKEGHVSVLWHMGTGLHWHIQANPVIYGVGRWTLKNT